MQEKKFCTVRNPLTGGDGRALEPQRGALQQVLRRQNREFTTEIAAEPHFPDKKWLACLQCQVGWSSEAQGFKGPASGTGLRLAVMKILFSGYSTAQMRQSRKD